MSFGAIKSGIEPDLQRRVGRTNFGDPLDATLAHSVGHRQRVEEGVERHFLVDLDENCSSPPNEYLVSILLPAALKRLSPTRQLYARASFQPSRMHLAAPNFFILQQRQMQRPGRRHALD